ASDTLVDRDLVVQRPKHRRNRPLLRKARQNSDPQAANVTDVQMWNSRSLGLRVHTLLERWTQEKIVKITWCYLVYVRPEQDSSLTEANGIKTINESGFAYWSFAGEDDIPFSWPAAF